jgi:hypothetical protein
VWQREKPNSQALRLHEADMLELERLYPALFITIEHFPGELMIVLPGPAQSQVRSFVPLYNAFKSFHCYAISSS